MTYKIKYKIESDYVRAETFGVREKGLEVQEALELLEEITKYCVKNNIYKTLIISHITGYISSQDVLKIINKYSTDILSIQLKTALFFSDSNSSRFDAFTEFVAENRGLNLKVFDNERSALDWLV